MMLTREQKVFLTKIFTVLLYNTAYIKGVMLHFHKLRQL